MTAGERGCFHAMQWDQNLLRSGAISGQPLYNTRAALAFTEPGTFKARQTWIALKHLHVLEVEETLPRIAYLSLSSDRVHISFPSNAIFNPVWGGIALRPGEIVFHGHGQGAHDRTTGPSCWGLISIESQVLADYAHHVAAIRIAVPQVGQILRPLKSAATRLIQLHRKACRMAAKNPALFSHGEVSRALENELLDALGHCLVASDTDDRLSARARKFSAMAAFEGAVRAHLTRPLTAPFSTMIGIPERTLRSYCAGTLGMSPNQYLRLLRLNLIRAALRHSDPASTSVEAVARHYQFTELGRFAVTYREIFGESPSRTLHSAGLKIS